MTQPSHDPYGSSPTSGSYAAPGSYAVPPSAGYGYYGDPSLARRPGRGLAIAALVTGGVALLVSWVPFVNLIGLVAGLVAVGLGVVALVLVRRGRTAGRGMAWTGASLGAAAVVLALVVDIATGVALVRDAREAEADQPSAAASGPATPAPEDPSTPAPSTPEPSAAAPGDLALGQTAQIGDYTVAVTGVTPNANDLIAQASEYNEPPTGQYVLVQASVTYNSSTEGNTGLDVYPSFIGSDNVKHYSSGDAMPPESAYELEPLRPGGSAQFQAAFDVPPSVISGGVVRVQDLAHPGLDEPKVYWSTDADTAAGGSGATQTT